MLLLVGDAEVFLEDFSLLLNIDRFIIEQEGLFVKGQDGLVAMLKVAPARLRFIEEEATAKRARAQIRPGDWSLVKGVGG